MGRQCTLCARVRRCIHARRAQMATCLQGSHGSSRAHGSRARCAAQGGEACMRPCHRAGLPGTAHGQTCFPRCAERHRRAAVAIVQDVDLKIWGSDMNATAAQWAAGSRTNTLTCTTASPHIGGTFSASTPRAEPALGSAVLRKGERGLSAWGGRDLCAGHKAGTP